MSKVSVMAGPCGLKTVIEAEKSGRSVKLKITSECKAYNALNEELATVNPNDELFSKDKGIISESIKKHSLHPACPVGVGILKAVEVAAGMALAVSPEITVEK